MRQFFFLLMFLCYSHLAHALPLQSLKLPPGFQIEVFAEATQARQLALGQNAVFVGSMGDKVYAIVPANNHKQEVITLAQDLNAPNGVAFHNGNLYVAEIDKISRYDAIESHLRKPPKSVVIAHLPKENWHGYRVIKIGPDEKIYVGIGAPCDSCLKEDPIFATILRMNLDGSNPEIYAKGVRNTVGFDWDPRSQKLWFTDNGRDRMGDEIPPDELNFAPLAGMHFGFPYRHGRIPDPTYGKMHDGKGLTAPALELPAHVAALGLKFYSGKTFPTEYQDRAFIAEHGSWNRSKKIGYQVISVKVNGDKASDAKPFVSGWLQGEDNWGRPVDIAVMRDGSILISDDFANVVYRVSYTPTS